MRITCVQVQNKLQANRTLEYKFMLFEVVIAREFCNFLLSLIIAKTNAHVYLAK